MGDVADDFNFADAFTNTLDMTNLLKPNNAHTVLKQTRDNTHIVKHILMQDA